MLLGGEGFDYLSESESQLTVDPRLGPLGWYDFTSLSAISIAPFSAFNYGFSLLTLASSGAVIFRNQVNSGFIGTRIWVDSQFAHGTPAEQPFLQLIDAESGIAQFTITFEPFGCIGLWTGGDVFETPTGMKLYTSPAGTYYLDTWFYLEAGWLISPSVGTFEVRKNTVPIAQYINLDTQMPMTNAWCSAMKVGVNSLFLPTYWDDLYWADDTGSSPNNTFLGNIRAQGLLPAAPGSSTTWNREDTMLANWQNARNQDVNDTLYVYSGVPGDFDLYLIDPLINSPYVFGVQVKGAVRQDDATQRFYRNTLLSDMTQVFGATYATDSNYSFVIDMFEENPDTMLPWLDTEVNAIEIGPEVES